jgi:integrase
MRVTVRGVKAYRSKGRVYYYHRATGTRLLAAPGTPAFFAQIQFLDDQVAERAPKSSAGTLGALIIAYRGSPEFARLADRTKKDYLRILDYLAPLVDVPCASFTTASILKARDKALKAKGRKFANDFIVMLSILWNWGRPRELCVGNPAADAPRVRKPRGAPQANRAWSPEELDVVLEAMPSELRLAIALGAYGGFREGDIVRLSRQRYSGGLIQHVQRKTGQPVWIPVHRRLKAILDAELARRDLLAEAHPERAVALTLVAGARGRPFTENGLRARIFKTLRTLETAGQIGPGLTIHGLRHTAATMLADAGCDTRDIMSITGHATTAQVETYVRGADQRRRAEGAIARLEAAEKNEVRKNLSNAGV